jgi:hypothetical protein
VDFVTWLRAQRDRLAGWACIGLGAVMVISAWFSISGTSVVSAQLTYLASGGIGGLFFLGGGFGLLVRADLHDEWRKLDRIEGALLGSPLPDTQAVKEAPRNGAPAAGGTTVQSAAPALMMSANGSVALASPVASRQEAVLLGGVLGAGALALLGWFRVSGTTDTQSGFNGLTIGLFGLLLAAAVVVYHSRSMRFGIAERRSRLFSWVSTTSGEATRGGAKLSSIGWYVVKGSGRYHVAGCHVLDTERTTEHVSSKQHLADLEPCRLCDAG